MMPDDGNLDPRCSRLHHDEYETNGGLITHLQSLNPQSNREVRAELGTMRNRDDCRAAKTYVGNKWERRNGNSVTKWR